MCLDGRSGESKAELLKLRNARMALTDALLLEAYPLDVWIALRTDGAKGSGTEQDPYNATSRRDNAISITNLTSSGREATATTAVNHGYLVSEVVIIEGVTGAGAAQFNGRFSIYGLTATTFKYKMLADPAGSIVITNATCAKVTFPLDDVLYTVALENTTVHLGPGVFETRGMSQLYGARFARSGQKIFGSGMGVTTLKIVHGYKS